MFYNVCGPVKVSLGFVDFSKLVGSKEVAINFSNFIFLDKKVVDRSSFDWSKIDDYIRKYERASLHDVLYTDNISFSCVSRSICRGDYFLFSVGLGPLGPYSFENYKTAFLLFGGKVLKGRYDVRLRMLNFHFQRNFNMGVYDVYDEDSGSLVNGVKDEIYKVVSPEYCCYEMSLCSNGFYEVEKYILNVERKGYVSRDRERTLRGNLEEKLKDKSWIVSGKVLIGLGISVIPNVRIVRRRDCSKESVGGSCKRKHRRAHLIVIHGGKNGGR